MRFRPWWALRQTGLWSACTWRSRGWWAWCSRAFLSLTAPWWRERSVWPAGGWTWRWTCQEPWWTESLPSAMMIKVLVSSHRGCDEETSSSARSITFVFCVTSQRRTRRSSRWRVLRWPLPQITVPTWFQWQARRTRGHTATGLDPTRTLIRWTQSSWNESLGADRN